MPKAVPSFASAFGDGKSSRSSHPCRDVWWAPRPARELKDLGHEVRLMPPGYVKPFVRRQAKNDATDAAAICEAVTRPNMRFVSVKSPEQRGFLMLHRARGLLVRQRTMTACAIRAHLASSAWLPGRAGSGSRG